MWKVGQQVQAGFMQVTVKAVLLDSVCIVSNSAGTQLYRFTPYNGINKITIETAKALLARDAYDRQAMLDHVAAIQAQRGACDTVFA